MDETKRRKLTKDQRQIIYEKCDGHCAYCGRKINISEMQVDHVKPLSIDGTNAFENLLPSCRGCNNYKSSLTLEKFRKAAEHWPEVLMRDNFTYRNAVRFGLVVPKPAPVIFYFENMLNERTRDG
ncbi:MAG: HNH endonuclease [Flexilinea sp.]